MARLLSGDGPMIHRLANEVIPTDEYIQAIIMWLTGNQGAPFRVIRDAAVLKVADELSIIAYDE
jgi:hypothetical protein